MTKTRLALAVFVAAAVLGCGPPPISAGRATKKATSSVSRAARNGIRRAYSKDEAPTHRGPIDDDEDAFDDGDDGAGDDATDDGGEGEGEGEG